MASTAPAPSFIAQAPASVQDWVQALDTRPLPVLPRTAEAVWELSANEDAVDAHLLSQTLVMDPLATLKLLRHVAQLRRGRAGTDAETVTEALLLLGISPFFRAFAPPLLDTTQWLAGHAAAQAGLQTVLDRAQRAARLALGFAIHRQDPDAAVIHEAALLHDFVEMLLWLHAPALAQALAEALAATDDSPQQRSAVQQAVLGVDLTELQQALMQAWRLPELLVHIADDHSSEHSQVRNVQLAIRLARHSADNWHHPALEDDIAQLATLLTLNSRHALALARDIDA